MLQLHFGTVHQFLGHVEHVEAFSALWGCFCSFNSYGVHKTNCVCLAQLLTGGGLFFCLDDVSVGCLQLAYTLSHKGIRSCEVVGMNRAALRSKSAEPLN